MTSLQARRALQLLLRFSIVYGVLVWICYLVPAYAWVERGSVAVVDASFRLADGPGESRALRLESQGANFMYVYDVATPGSSKTLQRGYHRHAFILVLFIGLALGTPGLSWRRRLVASGVGGVLTFALCTGMLMSDLQGWERGAIPDSGGPYPGLIMSMRGLHNTAAGGMLPIIVWAFLVADPVLTKLRRAALEAERAST